MTSNQGFIKFCGLSVVLHALFWLIMNHLPALGLDQNDIAARTPVEVIYKPEKEPHKLHVTQLDAPEPLDDPNNLARFDSAKRQRVKEETQARVTGQQTVNRKAGPKGQPAAAPAKPKKVDLRQPLRMPLPNDERGPGARANEDTSENEGKLLHINPGVQISENNQLLPDDIKTSSSTVLNTDRYLFYSFYDRLEKRVVPRWYQFIRQTYDRAVNTRQLKMGEWTTVVEVLYTPEGDYVRSQILQSGGWEALDNDAVNAFRAASRIPHPPPEMVKADGEIHVIMGFNVRVH